MVENVAGVVSGMAKVGLSDGGNMVLPKLTDVNFMSWKFMVGIALKKRGLDKHIDGSFKLVAGADSADTVGDDEAKALLVSTLNENDAIKVIMASTCFEGYEQIVQSNQLDSRQRVMCCRTKLYGLKHFAGGNLKSLISEIEINAAIIRNSGEFVDDLAILFNSMPAEYGVVVEALKNVNDLSFARAKQRLLEFDSRLEKACDEKILAAKSFDRGCFFCKKPCHFKKDCADFKAWLK
jgi:hypothetical protein